MDESSPKPSNPNPPRDSAAQWLLGRINYERASGVPYAERQLKLDRMRQFVTALGSPDSAAPIVHIAGTKGKGSTAAMLAAMLTAAGYRTGVFSSPHLERLEERFAIDGQPATADELEALVDCVRPVVEDFDQRTGDQLKSSAGTPHDGSLTFFDITTAIALVHFAQQECGAVVLEVGLGGRLDSTNVCLPAVSVITSISLDHTRQLGDTLGAIAGEKAGIIKPGVPVISGVVQEEPRDVIAHVARQHSCRLVQRGRDYDYKYRTAPGDRYEMDYRSGAESLRGMQLALAGEHQAANAAVALATIEELAQQGWDIPESARREGLQAVRIAGRFEVVPGEPIVVLDTAHNESSAAALAATLSARNESSKTLVVACSTDKDTAAIARELAPVFDRVVVTEYLDNPRAKSRDELASEFAATIAELQLTVDRHIAATPLEAWRLAQQLTPRDGLICVAGSFYLTAELRPVVLSERG